LLIDKTTPLNDRWFRSLCLHHCGSVSKKLDRLPQSQTFTVSAIGLKGMRVKKTRS
jgi:hypothetical protein